MTYDPLVALEHETWIAYSYLGRFPSAMKFRNELKTHRWWDRTMMSLSTDTRVYATTIG